jgi:hypothetical protein
LKASESGKFRSSNLGNQRAEFAALSVVNGDETINWDPHDVFMRRLAEKMDD